MSLSTTYWYIPIPYSTYGYPPHGGFLHLKIMETSSPVTINLTATKLMQGQYNLCIETNIIHGAVASVIGVYLPYLDQGLSTYTEHLIELEGRVSGSDKLGEGIIQCIDVLRYGGTCS